MPSPSHTRSTCIDGRHFSFAVPPNLLDVGAGAYVALAHPDGPLLGQVTGLELTRGGTGPAVHVDGRVLDAPVPPFDGVATRAATPDELASWLERTRPDHAMLRVGIVAAAPNVALELDAAAFRRHTFLCGQSGSGKTYALGTILERLLLETNLRIVVLDPNSDFTRLAETREGVDTTLADRYREATSDLAVRRAGGQGAERLHVRYTDFDAEERAATLRLDPITDLDEYAALVSLVEGQGSMPYESTHALAEALQGAPEPAMRALGLRLTNLGVQHWRLWSFRDTGSLGELVGDGGPRALVVDLGSLPTRAEKALAAEATLAALWRRRETRDPTLVVIDEAHNVCPGTPADPLTALATEHAVRIAGEGRKFGLTLLVSTQRPQKIHDNVISQCDNLVLMRMNSRSDLAAIGSVFSFVPEQLLARATDFGLGETLVAGGLVSHPTLARIGPRWSAEGGGDPPADWASPR
jgi:DNA helicase HerA-like ATPase